MSTFIALERFSIFSTLSLALELELEHLPDPEILATFCTVGVQRERVQHDVFM